MQINILVNKVIIPNRYQVGKAACEKQTAAMQPLAVSHSQFRTITIHLDGGLV
jgi:hypothetical protein